MISHNRVSRRWMMALTLVFSLFLSNLAFAQDAEKPRLALLDIREGGTEILTKQLEDAGFEVKDQAWFLKQVKARAISPKKLLRRPKDLRFVINGAKIDGILYFKAQEDDTFDVTLIGKEGKPVREFKTDQTSEGLSENGAKLVVDEIKDEFGMKEEAVAVATVDTLDEPDPAEGDVSSLKDEAKKKEDEVSDRLSNDWLFARVYGRLMKRDLNVTGANGAVLSYASTFYPGFEAELEVYPGAPISEDYADVAVFVDYVMGFGSVTAEGADAGTVEELPITQMEIEGGTKYRLVSPLGQESSTTMVQAQIKLSGRYTAFNVDANRSLPKTTMIEVIVGASVLYPVLFDGFAVSGFFDVTPFGVWGEGKELFGKTASTYGFSAGLGGVYEATESIGISFGYRFRVLRTSFEGDGELDFTDSDAFELVQAANLGIVYQH